MADIISKKKVLPSGPISDILFVGESPGYDEDISGIPFSGDTGNIFNNLLGSIGLSRDRVRITNLCNYRPNNNKFDLLLNTPQLKEGIDEVFQYINTRKPKWVVLLGSKPLEYIARKKNIDNWRSSVIIYNDDTKFFITNHPAACLWNPSVYPLLSFDFRRLERYIRDGYSPPNHEFSIDPKGLDAESCLREIEKVKKVAVDIEGVKSSTHILCCGFALSDSRAICFANHGFSDFTFRSNISRILENPDIEKIFQNGFGYDVEVLRLNGIEVKNYSYDTMIGAHILEPELSYGLDFLTSIYTDEAYYKDKGRSAIPDDDNKGWREDFDKEILYDYNCVDCIVTYQIARKQEEEIADRGLRDVLRYKHSLIPVGLELSRSGMEVDETRRAILLSIVDEKRIHYQRLLNTLAGFPVNVKSGPQKKKLLIDKYNLPERRNRNSKGLTFDEDAIVSYISVCQTKIDELATESKKEEWYHKLVACKCILLVTGYRQLKSNYLNVSCQEDGRTRSMYNLSAATETGRGSSHKYVDGKGINAQTWPREVFEISDEEYSNLISKLT